MLHNLHIHSITESDESSGRKTGRVNLSKNAESSMQITAKDKSVVVQSIFPLYIHTAIKCHFNGIFWILSIVHSPGIWICMWRPGVLRYMGYIDMSDPKG